MYIPDGILIARLFPNAQKALFVSLVCFSGFVYSFFQIIYKIAQFSKGKFRKN